MRLFVVVTDNTTAVFFLTSTSAKRFYFTNVALRQLQSVQADKWSMHDNQKIVNNHAAVRWTQSQSHTVEGPDGNHVCESCWWITSESKFKVTRALCNSNNEMCLANWLRERFEGEVLASTNRSVQDNTTCWPKQSQQKPSCPVWQNKFPICQLQQRATANSMLSRSWSIAPKRKDGCSVLLLSCPGGNMMGIFAISVSSFSVVFLFTPNTTVFTAFLRKPAQGMTGGAHCYAMFLLSVLLVALKVMLATTVW